MKTSQESNPELTISMMGEAAILFDAGVELDVPALGVQKRIWSISKRLQAIKGVSEVIIGMNNFLVSFVPADLPHAKVQNKVSEYWQQDTLEDAFNVKSHIIDVVYGGGYLEDLKQVAEYSQLSIDQVIELHSTSKYTVFAIGSQPGLPYLGGLSCKLNIPRRSSPRAKVESGAVIIGGGQASVLSRTSACGWHIIGQTDYDIFNIDNDPPATFSPGDLVEFRVKGVNI
ncbi:5-oxoprolinase subunit PxpB [Marinomonas sp.]|nr:5-oxoprolinase subunit PxpB [Marinomonas sp.]MDB4837522.1 5-oxoprolinase subunit PxpB [Marinomonas sp.]